MSEEHSMTTPDPLRAAALRIPGPEMEEFGTIDWRSWALSVRDAALAAEARPEAHPNWLRVGNVAEARPELGAAWAEAEAALPKGWGISLSSDADPPTRYRASAGRIEFEWPVRIVGPCFAETPADALRALAARLTEEQS